MSSSKNVNARERARLAAEQAAARKRDRRILIAVVAIDALSRTMARRRQRAATA